MIEIFDERGIICQPCGCGCSRKSTSCQSHRQGTEVYFGVERRLKILKGVLLLRRVNRYQSKEEQIEEIDKYCSDEEIDRWIEALKKPEEETEFEGSPEIIEEEQRYTSCTARDYSPSNPWDAPGMSIRDFI